jgi:hypothetical protein
LVANTTEGRGKNDLLVSEKENRFSNVKLCFEQALLDAKKDAIFFDAKAITVLQSL